MEKIDLSKISLKEAGINSYSSFYLLLRQNNITTVSQLLDDDNILEILKKAKSPIRNELLGFIEVLKNRYLGLPLPKSIYLDTTPVVKKDKRDITTCHYPIDLTIMGFTKRQSYDIESAINHLASIGLVTDDTKLVESFIHLLSKRYTVHTSLGFSPKTIIQQYVDCYQKDKQEIFNGDNIDTLTFLKHELATLVDERNSLDSKITKLQQQIDSLINLEGDKECTKH